MNCVSPPPFLPFSSGLFESNTIKGNTVFCSDMILLHLLVSNNETFLLWL